MIAARVLCLLFAVACSPRSATFIASDAGNDGGSLAGLVSMRIEPADATLIVGPAHPSTRDYVAMGTFDDGTEQDITGSVAFELADPMFGTFSGATLMAIQTRGFRTTVRARSGEIEATTALVGKLAAEHVNTPGWQFPATIFAQAPTAIGSNISYPFDGTVVPPNLQDLEVLFPIPGDDHVYMLEVTHPLLDLRLYFTCGDLVGTCVYKIPAQAWAWISATARGDDPIEWNVSASMGTQVARGDAPRRLAVAPDDLEGVLYYASPYVATVHSYDFQLSSPTPQRAVSFPMNRCIGCHAVSRDGRKLLATEAAMQSTPSGTDGSVFLWDLYQYQSITTTNPSKATFGSWNPDGTLFAATNRVMGSTPSGGKGIAFFDGATGTQIAYEPLDSVPGSSTMVDWSQDGTKLVFGMGSGAPWNYGSGSIWVMTGAGTTFTDPVRLTSPSASSSTFGPSIGPDSNTVAFNEVRSCSGGATCSSYGNPAAALYLLRLDDQLIIPLAKANDPESTGGNFGNSYPRWNQKIYRRTSSGGRLAWLAFGSKRHYPQIGTASSAIWIAAIDLDAPAGADPSSPPFILPNQDRTMPNYLPTWSVRPPPP